MNLLKKISFLALFITLNSCKDNSFNSDTETYKIEIKKAEYFHHDFTNHIQETPLNINAESITLKEIFGMLIKTDTSNIKFDNEKTQNKKYALLVKQKDKNIPVNEVVLNKIINELNLKLIKEKYQSFNITIKDSLKYSKFTSNSKNKTSSVNISKDSIKLSNCDLNMLIEILNSEYPEKITCDTNSEKINYKWKKSSFDKLKLQFKNDLGMNFFNSNNDRIIYRIKNN
jgi:hypothetical protein